MLPENKETQVKQNGFISIFVSRFRLAAWPQLCFGEASHHGQCPLSPAPFTPPRAPGDITLGKVHPVRDTRKGTPGQGHPAKGHPVRKTRPRAPGPTAAPHPGDGLQDAVAGHQAGQGPLLFSWLPAIPRPPIPATGRSETTRKHQPREARTEPAAPTPPQRPAGRGHPAPAAGRAPGRTHRSGPGPSGRSAAQAGRAGGAQQRPSPRPSSCRHMPPAGSQRGRVAERRRPGPQRRRSGRVERLVSAGLPRGGARPRTGLRGERGPQGRSPGARFRAAAARHAGKARAAPDHREQLERRPGRPPRSAGTARPLRLGGAARGEGRAVQALGSPLPRGPLWARRVPGGNPKAQGCSLGILG